MPRWLDRVAALGVPWATLADDLTAARATSGRPTRPADLVLILRDLPHAEPSRTDTANALAEWCATGWLKHRLLVAAMNSAGLSARLLMASYRFDSSLAWLPSSVRAPDVLQQVGKLGSVPVTSSPAAFRKQFDYELAYWKKIVQDNDIKLDE